MTVDPYSLPEIQLGRDLRRIALKTGLEQLRAAELYKLIVHIESSGSVLLDRDPGGNANYSNGVYCPLAIGVGVPAIAGEYTSDESVYVYLTRWCGFKIYNTRGISGEFYTTDRQDDLLEVAREILAERGFND